MHIRWSIRNRITQCAIPRCRQPIGPTYLGLDICWHHFGLHCDSKRFCLSKFAVGEYHQAYVAGRYWVVRNVVWTPQEEVVSEIISRGDTVTWGDKYKQYGLKSNEGTVEKILAVGFKNLDQVIDRCPLERVVVLWIRVKGEKSLFGMRPENLTPISRYVKDSDMAELMDEVDDLWGD